MKSDVCRDNFEEVARELAGIAVRLQAQGDAADPTADDVRRASTLQCPLQETSGSWIPP